MRRAYKKRIAKKKHEKRNERGLSTIVATLLIILLTLVAVGIMWVVIRNVIQEGSEQVSLGKFTLNLEIKSVLRDMDENSMNIKIKRNTGEGEISGLEFIAEGIENTEIVKITNISLRQLEERTFNNINLTSATNISTLISVSVAPIFRLESGKDVVGDIADVYTFSGNLEKSQINCVGTCLSLGYNCGIQDICGNLTDCGSCSNGDICNGTTCGPCQGAGCIASCGDLLVAGTTYSLTSNVSSTGTCFNIAAQNIVLDCNNNWITYSTAGLGGNYGAYSNQFNTTIKNCNIIDGNWISSQYTRHGIYFNNSNNSNLFDNFVNVSSSYGIYVSAGSNFNTLINNIGTSDIHDGISLLGSSNNILTSNEGRSSWNVGISIYSSSNNILTNNLGTCFGEINNICAGLILTSSSNNTLTGNTGKGNYWYGIAIQNISNSVLIGNNGTSFGDIGMEILLSSNNTFTNNIGISNHSSGIELSYSSINNTLTGNTGISLQGRQGIALHHDVSKNILTNNLGIGNDQPGIFIYSASDNNFLINNTAISNTSMGLAITGILNNTFVEQTAIGGTYGIRIINSSVNSFQDCGVIYGGIQNINITADSFGNTFTNCPY